MINRLTAVPIDIVPIMAMDNGFCSSEPISEENKSGTMAKIVVSEVMIMGRRRLRPIIMTSLTTIFAMVPLLFSSDMGSELQKPLSIAMIGTMSIGTAVSLFIIPLLYWFIYRKKEEVRKLK